MCYGDMCRRLMVHTWWPGLVARNPLTFFDRIWTEGVKGKATKALGHLQKPVEHLDIIGLGFICWKEKKNFYFSYSTALRTFLGACAAFELVA